MTSNFLEKTQLFEKFLFLQTFFLLPCSAFLTDE